MRLKNLIKGAPLCVGCFIAVDSWSSCMSLVGHLVSPRIRSRLAAPLIRGQLSASALLGIVERTASVLQDDRSGPPRPDDAQAACLCRSGGEAGHRPARIGTLERIKQSQRSSSTWAMLLVVAINLTMTASMIWAVLRLERSLK